MAELQLTLNAEEQTVLGELLETTLKNLRIEEHRTRTPTYRETVLQQEKVVTALLTKLGRPGA
ncbi:MAG TPA: hypothetical protein VEL76_30405 [Gemmataceae bacterium]|nr:hypothetical protein [Gemmataceae bacterium]